MVSSSVLYLFALFPLRLINKDQAQSSEISARVFGLLMTNCPFKADAIHYLPDAYRGDVTFVDEYPDYSYCHVFFRPATLAKKVFRALPLEMRVADGGPRGGLPYVTLMLDEESSCDDAFMEDIKQDMLQVKKEPSECSLYDIGLEEPKFDVLQAKKEASEVSCDLAMIGKHDCALI